MKKLLLHCSIAPLLKRKQPACHRLLAKQLAGRSNNETMKQFARGFTLIELMVSMAILAILAGGVIAALNPVAQFQKSRDAHRRSDLTNIQKALELYYQDRNRYPFSTSDYQIQLPNSLIIDWGDPFAPYMANLPRDPNYPTRTYRYVVSSNGQAYWLFASYERGSLDTTACTTTPCQNVPSGVYCGSSSQAQCTFGVSSPNVSVNLAGIPTVTPIQGGGTGIPGSSGTPPVPTGTQFPSTGLVAYWNMDEDSNGTSAVERKDIKGASNLNDNNFTRSALGNVNNTNAASFTASSQNYLTVGDNDNLSMNNTDFIIAAWVRLNSVGSNNMQIIEKRTLNTACEYSLRYNGTTNPPKFHFGICGNGATAVANVYSQISPVANTWYFVIAWLDRSTNTINLQVNNGVYLGAIVNGAIPDTNTELNIGAAENSTGRIFYFDGLINEVGIWKRVLTAQERTTLYNGGNGITYVPPPQPFPTTGLVAYWNADEAAGDRPLYDLLDTHPGIPYNGVTTDVGKFNNARKFSAVGDIIDIQYTGPYTDTQYDSAFSSNNFTIAAWIQPTGAGSRTILSKMPTNGVSGYGVTLGAQGRVWCYTGTASSPFINSITGTDADPDPNKRGVPTGDGKFHHVVVVKSAGFPCRIYVDGQDRTQTTGVGTNPDTNNLPIRLGAYPADTTREPYTGMIDEIALWNVALDGSSVRILYNYGGGNPYTVTPTPPAIAGLVAQWKMNESSWDGTAGEVKSAVGTGIDGREYNGANTTSSNTVFGNAGNFDGTDDYVDIPAGFKVPQGAGSLSFWVHPRSYPATSYALAQGFSGEGFRIQFNASGNSTYGFDDNPSIVATTIKPNLNKWSYFVLKWDNTGTKLYINSVLLASNTNAPPAKTLATALNLGKHPQLNLPFNGMLDDVRFYNKALTQTEISQIYNSNTDTAGQFPIACDPYGVLRSNLLGYWKFDEASWNGTSGEVKDASANGNHGKTVNGVTPIANSRGAAFGNAADFRNSTTKYIEIPSSSLFDRHTDFSISAWVYAPSYTFGDARIVFRAGWWNLGHNTAGEIRLFDTNGQGAYTPQNYLSSGWYHLVATKGSDPTSVNDIELYINGVPVGSSLGHTPGPWTGGGFSTNVTIGGDVGTNLVFQGYIDEVRIYNRVLAQSDVSLLASGCISP